VPTKKSSSKSPAAKPRISRPDIPGYGMPKTLKGALTWSWASKQLEKSREYWISTVRPDGSPHTMIVWGLWMNNQFLFSTGKQSVKARNLAENNRCTVGSDDAAAAVIVEGTAALLTEASTRRQFFPRYEKKYKFDMSGMQEEPIFAVRPLVAFGLREKDFSKSATRWKF
jgi:pyridoxine/pyridoxamine 5'-phosphate oxidase